jgi:hypothetical protein
MTGSPDERAFASFPRLAIRQAASLSGDSDEGNSVFRSDVDKDQSSAKAGQFHVDGLIDMSQEKWMRRRMVAGRR